MFLSSIFLPTQTYSFLCWCETWNALRCHEIVLKKSFLPRSCSDWIYSDAWPWSRNQSVGSLGLFPRRTMTYPRTMVPLVFRKKNAARLDESKLVHSFAFHLYQVVIFSPMLLYAICLSIQRTECKKLRPLYQNPVMVLVNFMSFSVTFFWIWDWRLIQKRTYIDLLFLPTRLSWNSQPFCVRYSLDSELYSEAGPVVRYEIKRPYQELEYCQNHMSFASGLGMAQWKSPPCSDNNPGMKLKVCLWLACDASCIFSYLFWLTLPMTFWGQVQVDGWRLVFSFVCQLPQTELIVVVRAWRLWWDSCTNVVPCCIHPRGTLMLMLIDFDVSTCVYAIRNPASHVWASTSDQGWWFCGLGAAWLLHRVQGLCQESWMEEVQ